MKGVIFDFDGTLVDSMGYWSKIAAAFLKNQGITADEETIRIIEELPIFKSAELIKDKYGLKGTVDEIAKEIYAIMVDNYKYHIMLKENALDYLKKLKSQGIKMAIATATERFMIDYTLKRLEIEDYFDSILTCHDVNSGKNQSAAIYEESLKALNLKKEDVIIFEDAPHAIKTAKKAGFYIVGVYDNYFKKSTEFVKEISDKFIYSFNEM